MNLPTPSSALTNLVPVTSQESRHTRERNQFETVMLVVYLAVILFRKTFKTPVVISIVSLVGTLAEELYETLPMRCANSKTCSRLSKHRTLSGNPRTYGK